MKKKTCSLFIYLMGLVIANPVFCGNVRSASKHFKNQTDAPWLLPAIIGVIVVFLIIVAVMAIKNKYS